MELRITLQDIANACGVGKSTVARVLSNDSKVASKTRAAVLAQVKAMGYAPDPSLRVLSTYRWRNTPRKKTTIAVIDPKLHRTSPNSLAVYRKPIADAAKALGFSIEEFPLWKYSSTKRIGSILYNRGISAVLIPPVIEEVEWDWDWSRFCAIGCGIGEFRLPIHSVVINFFSAVRLCWQQCVDRGYKRIGALLYRQPGPDTNDSLRHGALLYEQSQRPKNEIRIPPFSGSFTESEKVIAWLKRYEPDVVISLNETAWWLLRDLGRHTPKDVGYCLISHSGQSEINAAGASSDHDHIAKNAINWLDQLLRSHQLGLPEVTDEIAIEPHWIEGSTLRPLVAP